MNQQQSHGFKKKGKRKKELVKTSRPAAKEIFLGYFNSLLYQRHLRLRFSLLSCSLFPLRLLPLIKKKTI